MLNQDLHSCVSVSLDTEVSIAVYEILVLLRTNAEKEELALWLVCRSSVFVQME